MVISGFWPDSNLSHLITHQPNQCWHQGGLHMPDEGVHWQSSKPRHYSNGLEDALKPAVRLPSDEEPVMSMSLIREWPPSVEPHVSNCHACEIWKLLMQKVWKLLQRN